ADVELAKDPADEGDPSLLKAAQLRLFDVLRKRKADREAVRDDARAEQRADPTRPPLPFYLGDKVKIVDAALSPSGDWLVLVPSPHDPNAKDAKDEDPKTIMPKYVTESGDVEAEDVRPKVGVKPVPRGLTLLDLRAHRRYDLDLGELPGIADDPLQAMRERA